MGIEYNGDAISSQEWSVAEDRHEEEELETVDWDVQIEQLPPRRSEQVVVVFTQGSYRPPRR